MYIKLTDRCNMHCAHCIMSSTAKGDDIRYEDIERLVEGKIHNVELGEYVALGGGEPTLHPRFLDILFLLVGQRDVSSIWFATNGTNKLITLAALELSKVESKISCEVSKDQYHDEGMVDPVVYRRAASYNRLRPQPGIYRDVIPLGRGAALLGGYEEPSVSCGNGGTDLFIRPDGYISYCSCKDSPIIGNLIQGIADPIYEYWYEKLQEEYSCHRRIPIGKRTKLKKLIKKDN